MKLLFSLPILFLLFFSCKKEDPIPKSTSSTPTVIGNWHWYRTDLVTYDMNGIEVGRSPINYPSQNVHTFNSNGFIYAANSTEQLGTHNGSNIINYGSQDFQVTSLTESNMIAKEFPSGCNNCTVSEYFYQRP